MADRILPPCRAGAFPVAIPRLSYADRIGAACDQVNRIGERRGDPFAFHAARDGAARELRAIERALRVDGL